MSFGLCASCQLFSPILTEEPYIRRKHSHLEMESSSLQKLGEQAINIMDRDWNIDKLKALLDTTALTVNSLIHHPNDVRKKKQKLLYFACFYEWPEAIALLLLYGADPFFKSESDGLSAYEWAVYQYTHDRTTHRGAYILALLNLPSKPPSFSGSIHNIGKDANAPLAPNAQANVTRVTPFIYACKEKFKFGLCWLIEHRDVNIYTTDTTGLNGITFLLNEIEKCWKSYTNFTRQEDDDSIMLESFTKAPVKLITFLQHKYPAQIDPLQWESQYPFAIYLIKLNSQMLNPAYQDMFHEPPFVTALNQNSTTYIMQQLQSTGRLPLKRKRTLGYDDEDGSW